MINLVKIDGVIGSLESDDGLSLVNPWSCSLLGNAELYLRIPLIGR